MFTQMVKPDAKAYAQKRKTFQKQVSCNTEHEFIILQNHSEKKSIVYPSNIPSFRQIWFSAKLIQIREKRNTNTADWRFKLSNSKVILFGQENAEAC